MALAVLTHTHCVGCSRPMTAALAGQELLAEVRRLQNGIRLALAEIEDTPGVTEAGLLRLAAERLRAVLDGEEVSHA